MLLTVREDDDLETLIDHAADVITPIFRMFGWNYGRGGLDNDQIRETIAELIETINKKGNRKDRPEWVESGRIRVTREKDCYNKGDEQKEVCDIHYGIYLSIGSGIKYA